MGVIVRTGAIKHSMRLKDFQNTLMTWDEIKDKALDSIAFSLKKVIL